jgi:hypothetical protein
MLDGRGKSSQRLTHSFAAASFDLIRRAHLNWLV